MATEQRLIDANKYHDVLSRSLDMTIGIEDSKAASAMAGTIIACQCLLDEQPTIDARPVVHGHWFLTEVEYLNCSACGVAYYTGIQTWSAAQDNLKYAGGHKYCPNCGAQMDGRRTE